MHTYIILKNLDRRIHVQAHTLVHTYQHSYLKIHIKIKSRSTVITIFSGITRNTRT